MENVLITGGDGYIGSYLADFLNENGYHVVITSHRAENKEARFLDLLDEASIPGICEACDIIIHTATYRPALIADNPRDALLANTFAARQIYLDAVAGGAKLFIYFSTFWVYGMSCGTIDESTVPNPKDDYSLTHWCAEAYLKQLSERYRLPVVVLRLTNGMGKPKWRTHNWRLLINAACKSVVENQTIMVNNSGLQTRDFVALADICQAVDCIIKHHINLQETIYEVYNVSSETSIRILDVALLIREIYEEMTGQPAELNIKSQPDDAAEEKILVRSQKLRALGWMPVKTMTAVIREILYQLLEESQYEMVK